MFALKNLHESILHASEPGQSAAEPFPCRFHERSLKPPIEVFRNSTTRVQIGRDSIPGRRFAALTHPFTGRFHGGTMDGRFRGSLFPDDVWLRPGCLPVSIPGRGRRPRFEPGTVSVLVVQAWILQDRYTPAEAQRVVSKRSFCTRQFRISAT